MLTVQLAVLDVLYKHRPISSPCATANVQSAEHDEVDKKEDEPDNDAAVDEESHSLELEVVDTDMT